MQIEGSVALVTGARRGLGAEWVRQLVARGASKVYAGVRDADDSAIAGAEVVRLDITDPAGVARAAHELADVSLLVNNAGISTGQRLVTGDLDEIRREMETHYFGTLGVVRAFAPVLARNGGGAILNVVSVLAWYSFDGTGAYSAAKAALWSLTDSVRLELAQQATQVTGLYVGFVDTDMTARIDQPKADPRDVVRAGLDGLQAEQFEVIADSTTSQVKASLNAGAEQRYPELAGHARA
jgi:NAD(P)-dependent dehydrogenase (short-subunit alcohol dehydrogenase family)